ncbi:MAG: hypothetical protein HY561_04765 [Gemmatimonadetes bacterium]|nr:hypothetical protein [Gemmatimonadota bacterium]
MRIAIDPIPVVVGIYAYVGEILSRTAQRREGESAQPLARRYAGKRGDADREVQRLVRALHADVKIADKLLKKTADVWKISQETDLVDLVVQARGDEPQPQAYVLLQPAQIRELLATIRTAAAGAGESEETLEQLERAADGIEARPSEYLTFGFDPWGV